MQRKQIRVHCMVKSPDCGGEEWVKDGNDICWYCADAIISRIPPPEVCRTVQEHTR